ncbi:MAG: RsbRD N-terminal domain-containing protein [Pyrinomonadaceae bacterium]
MRERFTSILRQQIDSITRVWVDEIYVDRRTHLPLILSAREQVEFLPELSDELSFVLDSAATPVEICEAAERLRVYPQVRFQQGVLIDEMARELMLLRDVFNNILWHEALRATGVDVRGMGDVLRRTNIFFDELIAQSILTYAACLRPGVPTRASVWPPPRRRRMAERPEASEL